MRQLLPGIVLVLATAGRMLAQEQEGADTSRGLPAQYADFLIASSTVSPDGKYAVIYPTSELCDDPKPGADDRCKNYLVALKPFAILTTLATKWPEFKNKSHGGISATWKPDSSAALVTLDSKWGPGDIFLYELHDGTLTRSTNLLKKAHDLLLPDYRQAKSGRYNDYFDFIFENEDDVPICEFTNDRARVRIRGHATTDPKGIDSRIWRGAVEAIWDIAQAKFTAQKIIRVAGGKRK